MGIFLLTAFFATSYYTTYSYIEPFLKEQVSMDNSLVTASLMLFGMAGILGSVAFSRYYTRNRYAFNTCCFIVIGACIALLLPVSGSIPVTLLLLALWGVVGTAFNIAMQSEIINIAPPEGTSVAMSIFSGIFNFGMVCRHIGLPHIGTVGGIIAVGTLLFWLFWLQKHMKAFYMGRSSEHRV